MDIQARDANLIQRIRNSDTTALNELVHIYAQRLVDVALTIVASPDLAEEVAQDVFKRIWDTRNNLDIRGSVTAYLIRAARNVAHNLRIHEQVLHKAESSSIETQSHSEPHLGERMVVSAEFTVAAHDAIARLSPRLREVFILRIEQGLSSQEVAEILGISTASVHKQMYRATKELAERLVEWADMD